MSVMVKDSLGRWVKAAGNGTLYADSPIGTILAYGGATAPNGFFICNGTELVKTAYPELYAVIGDSFGTASDNTKFCLPDLREATTKGVGLTSKSSSHYSSNGISLGGFIDDRIKTHDVGSKATGITATHAHTHSIPNVTSTGIGAGGYSGYSFMQGGETSRPTAGASTNSVTITDPKHYHTYTGGATTEVKAVGVNYIIKAKMAAVPADFMSKVDEAVEENIIDAVTDGNMKAVTSNAVYDYVANKTAVGIGTATNEGGSTGSLYWNLYGNVLTIFSTSWACTGNNTLKKVASGLPTSKVRIPVTLQGKLFYVDTNGDLLADNGWSGSLSIWNSATVVLR